jgi:hypothetical protein
MVTGGGVQIIVDVYTTPWGIKLAAHIDRAISKSTEEKEIQRRLSALKNPSTHNTLSHKLTWRRAERPNNAGTHCIFRLRCG